MQCTLICLYDQGTAIARDDLANVPRHVGNLLVDDWVQGGTFGRPVRTARLVDTGKPGIPLDVIPPLFEPQLIQMTKSRFVLRGFQIVTELAGVPRQVAQEWMVKLNVPAGVSSTEPPTLEG